jgi:hypothetical protein
MRELRQPGELGSGTPRSLPGLIGGCGTMGAMSYDLVFWQQDESVVEEPGAIYTMLLEGGRVRGVADLPIEAMLAAISDRFAGASREQNGPGEWIVWESPSGGGFQVEWSPWHVIASCRSATDSDMNALIDIAVDHGSRLYDPQTNERFA